MLSQAMLRGRTMGLFQRNLQLMHMRTVPGKNYSMPESVEDVVTSLDRQRPVFTMLYFSAAWNPMCAKIERDYENLTATRSEFTHIKVDCDEQPLVKKYFDARVEPQFLMLINGGEIARVVGYNFDRIDKIAQKVVAAQNRNDFGYYGNTGAQWERFYDEFDRWSRYGEYDKDAFRANYDYNTDMHRGPGTNNP